LFGQTDEQGYYKINQVCFGQAKLVVSHISCDPIDRTVTIRSNVKLNFELEHHINELSEIIISDDGLNQVNSSVNESQLNADQLTRLSNQNLAETLNSIAGVSSLKTGSSIAKPMIHGLFGSRVAIIANGMRMQDQEWGADHAPNVDLNGFESVQVVKGAAALKYAGDTAGGMILLSPERINLKDSLYGSTVLNGVDNGKGGSINTRLTRSFDNGYFISGHLNTKQFGDRQAPEYNLTNTGLKETSLGFRLGRTKILKGWEVNYRRFQNSTGILRSAHIGNIEDLLRALESNSPYVSSLLIM
jgi:iron complex outermembrane receptor protein